MESALVVAIVRSDKLDAVETRLHEISVRAITVIKARGFGEHTQPPSIARRSSLNDQVKIEIYVPSEQAELVATTIIGAAHTGLAGDGIVAILPVQRVLSVRTRSDTMPNQASE